MQPWLDAAVTQMQLQPPSPSSPVTVLQNVIKITNEPPKGLRANLGRTFQDITPEIYEGGTKSREFKKLPFGLAFFHAALLGCRKFGRIGWNVPFGWMDSDFLVSREQVQIGVLTAKRNMLIQWHWRNLRLIALSHVLNCSICERKHLLNDDMKSTSILEVMPETAPLMDVARETIACSLRAAASSSASRSGERMASAWALTSSAAMEAGRCLYKAFSRAARWRPGTGWLRAARTPVRR